MPPRRCGGTESPARGSSFSAARERRREGVLSRAPGELLSPVFYVSPEVDGPWMERELQKSMNRHMNFLNMDSLGMSFLPTIHRIGHRLRGLCPPLAPPA